MVSQNNSFYHYSRMTLSFSVFAFIYCIIMRVERWSRCRVRYLSKHARCCGCEFEWIHTSVDDADDFDAAFVIGGDDFDDDDDTAVFDDEMSKQYQRWDDVISQCR